MGICDIRTAEQQSVLSPNDQGDLSDLIGGIERKMGEESTIVIEGGADGDYRVDYVGGMRFGQGYLSPEFASKGYGKKAVIDAPHILLTDKKVSNDADLLPVLDRVNGVAGNLVVIAEDVEAKALETLLANNVKENFKCVAIRAPGFGDRRKAILADIATLIGGQVITEDQSRSLDSVTIADLGRASWVIANDKETIIVGGEGSQEEIDSRMKQIKAQAESALSEYERGKLEERLAKLANGVAIVRAGN